MTATAICLVVAACTSTVGGGSGGGSVSLVEGNPCSQTQHDVGTTCSGSQTFDCKSSTDAAGKPIFKWDLVADCKTKGLICAQGQCVASTFGGGGALVEGTTCTKAQHDAGTICSGNLTFNCKSKTDSGGVTTYHWDQIADCAQSGQKCSGGQCSGTSGGGGKGALGGSCATDSNCAVGLKCLGNVIAGSDHFCASPCAAGSACKDLEAVSYVITVPASFTPLGGAESKTHYGTTILSRATICTPFDGASGSATYCRYGCGKFMAFDPVQKACKCLPGYQLNSAKADCVFDTTSAGKCSIFTFGAATAKGAAYLASFGLQVHKPKCTACNSSFETTEALKCHNDVYFCNINTTGLNGECAEMLTPGQFKQCMSAQTSYSCNCPSSCLDNCDNANACYGCCSCTPTSTPLAHPTCS